MSASSILRNLGGLRRCMRRTTASIGLACGLFACSSGIASQEKSAVYPRTVHLQCPQPETSKFAHQPYFRNRNPDGHKLTTALLDQAASLPDASAPGSDVAAALQSIVNAEPISFMFTERSQDSWELSASGRVGPGLVYGESKNDAHAFQAKLTFKHAASKVLLDADSRRFRGAYYQLSSGSLNGIPRAMRVVSYGPLPKQPRYDGTLANWFSANTGLPMPLATEDVDDSARLYFTPQQPSLSTDGLEWKSDLVSSRTLLGVALGHDLSSDRYDVRLRIKGDLKKHSLLHFTVPGTGPPTAELNFSDCVLLGDAGAADGYEASAAGASARQEPAPVFREPKQLVETLRLAGAAILDRLATSRAVINVLSAEGRNMRFKYSLVKAFSGVRFALGDGSIGDLSLRPAVYLTVPIDSSQKQARKHIEGVLPQLFAGLCASVLSTDDPQCDERAQEFSIDRDDWSKRAAAPDSVQPELMVVPSLVHPDSGRSVDGNPWWVYPENSR